MDVLVVGSGAREHALSWKAAQSKRVEKVYIAPGNAGTERVGENVPIAANDIQSLERFASEKRIGLTIVGPDEPLSRGIVDAFSRAGLRAFGPSRAAAQIESSKSFAKEIMEEARIPTAQYAAHADPAHAHEYVLHKSLPLVIKADGLALGKGVYVCRTLDEAHAAIDRLMVEKVHGEAGARIVVEEFIEGEEVSVHALCDGINYALFPSAQDHKRVGEGNTGNNTGGMGVIAPVPWVDEALMFKIEHEVIQPVIGALLQRGIVFKGILYPGIMVTKDGIKVLEFNARFGDPEGQTYMRLLDSDLLDMLEAGIDGTIAGAKPLWRVGGAATIVLASAGYPGEYADGFPITGIEDAERDPNVVVFHAGTKRTDMLRTAGGRVLSVTATGSPLNRALELAYTAADAIQFQGKYMRRDIGAKSVR